MIVEVFEASPFTIITKSAFGDQTVNVGVPLQIPAKSVQDADETGSKAAGFVYFIKHAHDDTAYRGKQAVKKRAVFKEKWS